MEKPVKSFMFQVPTQIRFGLGLAENVGEIAKEAFDPKSAFIVTDSGVVNAGLVDTVSGSLRSAGIEVRVFERLQVEEPTDTVVGEGIKLLKEEKTDLVVGVGGGGSLDTAKAIAMLATNKGRINDYKYTGIPINPPLPILTVPTTAGTGSEIGRSFVYTDTKTKTKDVFWDRLLLPRVALFDPLLTVTLPPRPTAYAAFDALAQAIGTYVTPRYHPVVDALAISAIELISDSIRRAVANGEDIEAREKLMTGSLMAGLSMAHARCIADHAFGEVVGGFYGIPHGLAVAIFLPFVMEFSAITQRERFADIAEVMGERIEHLSLRDAALRSVDAVRRLLVDVGIPTLREAGVKEEDFGELTKRTLAHDNIGDRTNPRQMTAEDILDVYSRAYAEEHWL